MQSVKPWNVQDTRYVVVYPSNYDCKYQVVVLNLVLSLSTAITPFPSPSPLRVQWSCLVSLSYSSLFTHSLDPRRTSAGTTLAVEIPEFRVLGLAPRHCSPPTFQAFSTTLSVPSLASSRTGSFQPSQQLSLSPPHQLLPLPSSPLSSTKCCPLFSISNHLSFFLSLYFLPSSFLMLLSR